MKTCVNCEVEKELTEFYKEKRAVDGLYSSCKSCHYARAKRWAKSNRKKLRKIKSDYYARDSKKWSEYQVEWGKRNRSKVYAIQAKRRAKKKNQTPEMNKAEWVEIEYMYLYNQLMPGNWHVDHVKPLAAGGLHHPSNLQILSERDNLSKGAKWNKEELI